MPDRSAPCKPGSVHMKQHPTFGAVPNPADLRKDQEQQAQEADKNDEFLAKKLHPSALERLNKFEMADPTKVWANSPGPRLPAPCRPCCCIQADLVKAQLLRETFTQNLDGPRAAATKNGGITDSHVKQLIEGVCSSDPVRPCRGLACLPPARPRAAAICDRTHLLPTGCHCDERGLS